MQQCDVTQVKQVTDNCKTCGNSESVEVIQSYAFVLICHLLLQFHLLNLILNIDFTKFLKSKLCFGSQIRLEHSNKNMIYQEN